jgi:hypothetical protein
VSGERREQPAPATHLAYSESYQELPSAGQLEADVAGDAGVSSHHLPSSLLEMIRGNSEFICFDAVESEFIF